MHIVECSKEKPWGIHPAIRDNACTRCGWAASAPPAPVALAPRAAWTVIEGGMSAAA